MTKKDAIKVFEDKKIRAVWDDQKEEWYFSIVDVIEVLTDSERPRKYWGDLKKKLKTEGSQLSEEIGQLKLPSSDGKLYKTDSYNPTTFPSNSVYSLAQSGTL